MSIGKLFILLMNLMFMGIIDAWKYVPLFRKINSFVYSESFTAPKTFQGHQLIFELSLIETRAFVM